MSNPISPRRIEEVGHNAWPALQTLLFDGWVLRFAGGYTKRANSINPLYPAETDDLEAKVAACEAIYAAQGLPPIFRLTSFATPPGLDDLLAARGYRFADRSVVMGRPLAGALPPPRTGAVLEHEALDDWFPRYCRLSDAAPDHRATHAEMLRRIAGDPLFATLRAEDGEPVACGLAVREQELVGLFDVVTDPPRRGRGYGTTLVSAMLQWAAGCGATDAYLQVVATNDAARRLYARLGFADAYAYWYRLPE